MDTLIQALSPLMREIVEILMDLKKVRQNVGKIFDEAEKEVLNIWKLQKLK